MSDELIERWESAIKHYSGRFIDNGVESIVIRKSLIDDTISRIESLQVKVTELGELNKAAAKLGGRQLAHITELKAKVAELEAQVSELMGCCLQKDQQKSYMSKMVDDLQARLAKYEDKVLPEEIENAVGYLREQARICNPGGDLMPAWFHACADLIERLSRQGKL